MSKQGLWTIAIVLVLVSIAVGTIAWVRYQASRFSEISISQPAAGEVTGVYVSGAVSSAGFYELDAGGSLGALVQAAGVDNDADLSALELRIPRTLEETEPQKVNINRAETWLLEALPGIGEVRAQAIVAYREQNGPFHATSEIVEAANIGLTDYENLKDLITVSD